MNTEFFLKKHFYLVIALLVILNLVLSLSLQDLASSQGKKTFHIPSSAYVERIVGTFRTPVAFYFFMKGALELAEHPKEKIDALFELFRLAFRLEPKLINAAFLGGMVVPVAYEEVHRSIALMKEAADLNPEEWRLQYWIGFRYYEIYDPVRGARHYLNASKLPGALPFLAYSAVNFVAQQDSVEKAIIETQNLMESIEGKDAKDWALVRIAWLKKIQHLQNLLKDFRQKNGYYPEDLIDLVKTGYIDEIPEDEIGNGFFLTKPGDPDDGYRVSSL